MRLGVDARAMFASPLGSSGRDQLALYNALTAARPDWHVTAYHDAARAGNGRLVAGRFHTKPIGRSNAMWQRLRLPLAAWRDGADVLHCPLEALPTWCAGEVIAHVDDLPDAARVRMNGYANAPVQLSVNGRGNGRSVAHTNGRATAHGNGSRAADALLRHARNAARRASLIVCPTQHLRSRLIHEHHLAAERIAVAAPGPDDLTYHVPRPDRFEVVQRYNLPGPFVLHFGVDEPARNTRKLIEAWAMADHSIRRAMTLVVIGLNEDSGDDLLRIVNRLGLASSVRLMRWFAQPTDLPALLSAADVLAMPTRSSRFPRFLLRAWAARTAVLTSDVGAAAEVAGDAAVTVDPLDPCAIARGLKRLVHDARHRKQLVARGDQRFNAFTWSRSAELFARAIEQMRGVEPATTQADELFAPTRRQAA